MKNLKALVVLGHVAHNSVVSAFGAKKSATPFKHAGKNMLGELALFSSYHCSRYNTNTGVLTPKMFRDVFEKVRAFLED
jgi:uracil-DNA glycosylase